MKENIKDLFETIVKFFTNRIFIIFIVFSLLNYILIKRLFDLQIVNGQKFKIIVNSSEKKTISINAPRGTIFDSYGRPLAQNEIAFTIKLDPSVIVEDNAKVFSDFVDLMAKHNEIVVDEFPIILGEVYSFDFNGNTKVEQRWKEDMELSKTLTAKDTFLQLRKKFKLPEEMTDIKAREVLNLICIKHIQRYNLNITTIASNIKDETVAALEEKNQEFPGLSIDIDYLRQYPQGENFSHLLGYIRKIDQNELKVEYKGEGYLETSIVGKDGIEKAFERELKGVNGSKEVELSTSGRRVSYINDESFTSPIQGDKVILTLDVELQNKAYKYLEEMLKRIIINKIKGTASKEEPYTSKQVLISLINANNLSMDKILKSKEGSSSYLIKLLIEQNASSIALDDDYLINVKKFIIEMIESGDIALSTIIFILKEQEIITLDEEQIYTINRNNSIQSILIDKIEKNELTPQMINLDPYEGSVVVVDINDGSVLAAVSYPTYDNNELVNIFNNQYYNKLLNDPTSPFFYRAFYQRIAPGSTFKMITAMAGLETGIITENTKIQDRGVFTEANEPFAHCWIKTAGFHGLVDVRKALEVSCNFFFYQTSYLMGNSKLDTTLEGIATLNEYMTMFGLNDDTGIEISEFTTKPENSRISSPAYLKQIVLNLDENAKERDYRWLDGETIRTAIGQSKNNYTTAVMAKYIMTLANGGIRYPLHFLDTIENASGEVVKKYEPIPELELNFSKENWQAVYDGMYRVTQGADGTARKVFEDFPMEIGAKTGTAQESGNSHASFAAFAPFENPQIAVYCSIPNGDTLTVTAPSAQVSRDVIAAYFGLDKEPYMGNAVNTIIP